MTAITAALMLLSFCLCDITNSAPVVKKQNEYTYNLLLHLNNGHVLDEEVKIDIVAGTEYFRVPKHEDKEEIEVMQDFTKNLTMIHRKSENICYISKLKLDLETPPAELKTIIESEIPENNELELKEITSWRIDTVFTQRSLLGQNMAAMCARSSIHWIHRMNRTGSRKSRDTDHSRVRRSPCVGHVCWYDYQWKLAKQNGKKVFIKIEKKRCRKIYCR